MRGRINNISYSTKIGLFCNYSKETNHAHKMCCNMNVCISCQFVPSNKKLSHLLSIAVYTEMCQQLRGTCSLNNIVSWEHRGYTGKNPRKLTKPPTCSMLFKWMTATRKWHNNLSVFAAPVVRLQSRHLCRNRRCYTVYRREIERCNNKIYSRRELGDCLWIFLAVKADPECLEGLD